MKERMNGWLQMMRVCILKRSPNILTETHVTNAARVAGGLEITLEKFLATGNMASSTGLGMMQDKGLAILAENINRMRYMSHFRAVHRGAFFAEMRTTEVRQLLPDAWGFICPVHTPDGTPCGLLNHLTMNCIVSDVPDKKLVDNIPLVLTDLGMLTLKSVWDLGLDVRVSTIFRYWLVKFKPMSHCIKPFFSLFKSCITNRFGNVYI